MRDGIDLKVSHEWSSSTELRYYLAREEYLCGNNDTPAFASKVEMRTSE